MSDLGASDSDLRGALKILENHNELASVVREVNWDRELGVVTREVSRRKGPARLFTNVADNNPPGARRQKLMTS